MMSCVRFIDWNNFAEAIPAFLMIIILPLTFSVADGIAVGFIAHAVVRIAQGNQGPGLKSSLLLAAISIAYFVLITLEAR